VGVELTREERFDAVLAQVHAPVQRYLRRRTADADDVLAETLVVLWRRLDDVPEECVPWAYAVARGCLQNAARAERRRLSLVRRLAFEPDAPPPPEDPALAEALEELAPADREVLRLWAWEQLPPRDIAVVLGITANAASIRLHRATQRLRTTLLGKERAVAGQVAADGDRGGTRP
jgi:RNA polymerase sigma-70 factor (ECF subfamily)